MEAGVLAPEERLNFLIISSILEGVDISWWMLQFDWFENLESEGACAFLY
jgi:hypothetical protein